MLAAACSCLTLYMCQCFLLCTWLLPASCPLSCPGMCVLFPVLTWVFPAVYIDLALFSVVYRQYFRFP